MRLGLAYFPSLFHSGLDIFSSGIVGFSMLTGSCALRFWYLIRAILQAIGWKFSPLKFHVCLFSFVVVCITLHFSGCGLLREARGLARAGSYQVPYLISGMGQGIAEVAFSGLVSS